MKMPLETWQQISAGELIREARSKAAWMTKPKKAYAIALQKQQKVDAVWLAGELRQLGFLKEAWNILTKVRQERMTAG